VKTSVARLDAKIQRGRGKIASKFGQTFDVYRLGPNSGGVGIVSASSLFASNVAAEFERFSKKDEIEVEPPIKGLYFTASFNALRFQPGDVFVQRQDSYRYDGAVYTLGATRPAPRLPFFASTPIYATLSRPDANPQRVRSGLAPFSGQAKEYEWPLILLPGQPTASYAFVYTLTVGQVPATVPVYLGPQIRPGRLPSVDVRLPDDVPEQLYDAYLPVMPGVMLTENDVITGSTGDRFRIYKPFPVLTGAHGQYCVLSKKRV
jgi:hypothetical protein